MQVTELEIKGLKLVKLDVFGDKRGFFVERFNHEKFKAMGLPFDFVQDNHSRSAAGVLRGLHYQTDPAQGKLVGVACGRIWDVVVDIRRASPTFGKNYGVELSDENGLLLWVPAGFAHGFCVLGDAPADVFYKVDSLYNPRSEGGIHWADPDLAVAWPIKNPTVSARDKELSAFSVYRAKSVF